MKIQKSVARHCETNILYIPSALYLMKDVKPLLYSPGTAIFYKELERDLIDIEFHTSQFCIVYLQSGRETITTYDNRKFDLLPNEAIFLPQGLNLYSDYRNIDGLLNAYLIFFNDEIITDFLATKSGFATISADLEPIFKIESNPGMTLFFKSLQMVYQTFNNSSQILKLKLLELLHLIDLYDSTKQLRSSLFWQQQSLRKSNPKRNIKRLMEKYIISNLTVKDFAALSGRSISSFNREFKQLYGVTPKRWIVKRRLAHARMLLVEEGWSVTATANEIGYENISHFIAAFKKIYSQTPHQIKS